MAKRAMVLTVFFSAIVAGLLLSPRGIALLTGPASVNGVRLPVWALCLLVALAYWASSHIPQTWARVAAQFMLAQVVLPIRGIDPVLWTVVREACVLVLLILLNAQDAFGSTTPS